MSGRRRVQFSEENEDDDNDIDDDILNDILEDSPVSRRKGSKAQAPLPPLEPKATNTAAEAEKPIEPRANGSPEKLSSPLRPAPSVVDNKKRLMQELFLGVKDTTKAPEVSLLGSDQHIPETDKPSLSQSPSSSLLSHSGPTTVAKSPLHPPLAYSGEVKAKPALLTSSMDFDDDNDSDILGKLEPRPRRAAAGSKLMDDIFGRRSDKEAAAGSSSASFLDSLLGGGESVKPKVSEGNSTSREFQLDARYKQPVAGAGDSRQGSAQETSGGGLLEGSTAAQRRRRGIPTVGEARLSLDSPEKKQPQPALDDNPFPWMAKEKL
jgi:hypothetical protein